MMMMMMMMIFVIPQPCHSMTVWLSHCTYIGIINTFYGYNGSVSGVWSSGVCVMLWLSGISTSGSVCSLCSPSCISVRVPDSLVCLGWLLPALCRVLWIF